VIGAASLRTSPAGYKPAEGRNGFGWNHLLGQGACRRRGRWLAPLPTRAPGPRGGRRAEYPTRAISQRRCHPWGGPRDGGGLGSSNRFLDVTVRPWGAVGLNAFSRTRRVLSCVPVAGIDSCPVIADSRLSGVVWGLLAPSITALPTRQEPLTSLDEPAPFGGGHRRIEAHERGRRFVPRPAARALLNGGDRQRLQASWTMPAGRWHRGRKIAMAARHRPGPRRCRTEHRLIEGGIREKQQKVKGFGRPAPSRAVFDVKFAPGPRHCFTRLRMNNFSAHRGCR